MYHMLRCTNMLLPYCRTDLCIIYTLYISRDCNALIIQFRTCNRDVNRMISYLVSFLITIILVTQKYPFYDLKKENHCRKLVQGLYSCESPKWFAESAGPGLIILFLLCIQLRKGKY